MKRFAYIFTLFLGIFFAIKTNGACDNPFNKTNGNSTLCTTGAYYTISTITLTESGGGCKDAIQGGTLIIQRPNANWEFNTGATLTLGFSGGADLTAVTQTSITTSTITITIADDGNNNKAGDQITIQGIEIRNNADPNGTYNITYDNSGTATFTNLANGAALADLDVSLTAAKTASANGAWSTGATWGGSAPTVCDNITIPSGFSVTVTGATTANNVTIQSGGTLVTDAALTIDGTFTVNNGGTYRHNNATDVSTTIFAGTESIGNTSTLIFDNWHDGEDPLGTHLTSVGHVTKNFAATWNQDGTFGGATQKMFGTLTVTNGAWFFDDGTGASTQLICDDLITSGGGSITVASGADRDLNLTSGTYNNGGTFASYVCNEAVGNLTWVCNGDFSAAGDFTVLESTVDGLTAGSSSITVTGDMNVTSVSWFDINRRITGNVSLQVDGDINISSTDQVFFLNNTSTGILSVTCTNLNISAGTTTELFNGASGTANFTITNDVTVSGTASANFSGNDAFTGVTTIDIGGDFNMTSSGTVYGTEGYGNLNFTTDGIFNMDDGVFRGINHLVVGEENALSNYTLNSLDFDGGNLIFHSNLVTNGGTCSLDITNNCDINFSDAADNIICFNAIGVTMNAVHDFDVGGNLSISGNAAGYLFTSGGIGNETVDITGNLTISGGIGYFVGTNAAGNGHNIVTNIGGDISNSGGTLYLSSQNGGADINVTGSGSFTGGETYLKFLDGAATLDFGSDLTIGDGELFCHGSNNNATADASVVTVNGDFLMNGTGNLNFDQTDASTATHQLYCKGDDFTISGNGDIKRDDPDVTTDIGVAGTSVFAELYFDRAGTITYKREAVTANTYQTKQIITAGTTVDASTSTLDMSIGTHDDVENVYPPTIKMLDNFGTLIMGTNQIEGRSISSTNAYYFSVYNENGGEIKTANVNGFYSGSTSTIDATASEFDGGQSTYNACVWYLDDNSRITYNGTADQVVTGKRPTDYTSAISQTDIDVAANTGYKYGILNIDHQGVLGTNKVTPNASNVVVETQLELTKGEYDLNQFTTTIENKASTAIELLGVAGERYIKSEHLAATNNSKLRWYVEDDATAHIIPFGTTNGTDNYVPMTFDPNSSPAAHIGAYVDFSTRTTAASDNEPKHFDVTHMHSPTLGADEPDKNVIDRWWDIRPSVATDWDVNVTYTYRGAENTLATAPTDYRNGNVGMQRWDETANNWGPINGSAAAATAGTGSVTTANETAFSPRVLVSTAAILPIELSEFTLDCGDELIISWTTQTEINNDYFIVQKSFDGRLFNDIETVFGRSNSNSTQQYSVIDYDNISSAYYRLVQVDLDGTETAYPVKKSACQQKETMASPTIYPNPFINDFQIMVPTSQGEEISIQVLDNLGKRIIIKEIMSSSQQEIINLNLDNSLPKGVYFVQISTDAYQESYKILKQ